MTTTVPNGPAGEPARRAAGFGNLLRAEVTKLRSVNRWMLGLLTVVGLTLALSLFTAAGSSTNVNDEPSGAIGPDGVRVSDSFSFVHQPLAGDGSITARVLSLTRDDGAPPAWAKAGIMVKESTEPGTPYAAIMLTPGHGVRLQADFTTDVAGTTAATTRWLRLTRSGATITGYESADGSSWSEVGTVELDAVGDTIQVGLFVASPNEETVADRSFGASEVGVVSTQSTATFDNVRVDAGEPRAQATWLSTTIGGLGAEDGDTASAGEVMPDGGVFTVTGTGDIGPYPLDDDVVQLSLLGVIFGQVAVIAVGVLTVTSEFKRGLIRTTFMISPRRGRVLIAKAIVVGGATFMVGLVASVSSFFLTQPLLRSNGFGPPALPVPSLADGTVLRAVVGAAAFLSLVAVFSIGLGAILRRSVSAITVAVVLLVLSTIIVGGLPLSAAQWLMRTSPAAGLAILQTVERNHNSAVEPWSMSGPWSGLAVLAAYAVATLAVAVWLIRRRDA